MILHKTRLLAELCACPVKVRGSTVCDSKEILSCFVHHAFCCFIGQAMATVLSYFPLCSTACSCIAVASSKILTSTIQTAIFVSAARVQSQLSKDSLTRFIAGHCGMVSGLSLT